MFRVIIVMCAQSRSINLKSIKSDTIFTNCIDSFSFNIYFFGFQVSTQTRTMCGDNNIDCHNQNDHIYQESNQCPVLTEKDTDHLDQLEEWLSNILPIFIALFGIVSNLMLTINILKLQKLRQDVYQILLIALLSGDTLYLLLKLIGISKGYFSLLVVSTDWLFFDVIFHSSQRFALSFSTFMTVGITLERFITVHTPLR